MTHSRHGMSDPQVSAELAALPTLSIDALTQRWQALTGRPADRRNKRALVKLLAYALQAAAWGDLSPETRAQIAVLYHRQATVQPDATPIVGSVLVRSWHGVQYRVTILPQGFAYAGQLYASLSAVARAITGTRISGPVFFGLRGGAR